MCLILVLPFYRDKDRDTGKDGNKGPEKSNSRKRSPGATSIRSTDDKEARSKRSVSKERSEKDSGSKSSDNARKRDASKTRAVSRSQSPKRKITRPPPRYCVDIPKFSLDT